MLSRKLMFVVESVADQQAASTPLSDCRSRYVQSFGHLFLCEFAHLTKPIVAALQMIRTSQLGHNAPVEGRPLPERKPRRLSSSAVSPSV